MGTSADGFQARWAFGSAASGGSVLLIADSARARASDCLYCACSETGAGPWPLLRREATCSAAS
jgi:hypothetical protein